MRRHTPEVTFNFRVWLWPLDEEPPTLEFWWQGLEITSDTERSVSEWVEEALLNTDFYEEFKLDTSKYWQVIGTGTLRGSFDYWGEYDEELTLEVESHREETKNTIK